MSRFLCTMMLASVLVTDVHSSEKRSYELVGKIVRDDGKPFDRLKALVFLYGAITPFTAQTEVRLDGQFKFKNLPAATYTLAIAVPRAGELRKTVEVGPSFADSKGRVALTVKFYQEGSIEKKQVVSAVELSIPDNAIVEYSRAQEYLGRQDIRNATECLKKAVEIAPQFSAAWNNLGTISYQTRQYPQAEEYFREALRQDPDHYSPLVNLGGALLSQGKIEESLAINQRAAKVMPSDALAHSQLGQSYFFLGKYDEAESHLKQAKALDAGHFSHPQLLLMELYARRNQLPAAILEIEEFLKLHPDSDLAPKLRKILEIARAGLQKNP